MTKDTAKRIHEFVLKASAAIDDSVAAGRDDQDEEGFKAYRSAAARVLDNIMEELLKPIYREHADLIPPELDRRFLRL
jgi:hypothetical protein